MKRRVLLGIMLLAGFSIYAETKQESILKLLEVSGSRKLAIQVVEAFIPQLKALTPDTPEAFWEKIMKEIDTDEFLALSIPIYDKFYSHDEIRQLIAFYESAIGKKSVRIMPEMTRESMEAGQQWGTSLAMRIIEELQQAGYLTE